MKNKKSKQKKYPRSITMVTMMLVGIVFVIWFIGMYFMTAITSAYKANEYKEGYGHSASYISSWYFEDWIQRNSIAEFDAHKKSLFYDAVCAGDIEFGNTDYLEISGESSFSYVGDGGNVYAATAVYDAQGNCIEKSWEDYFWFQYQTEEQWANDASGSGAYVKVPFKRECFIDNLQESLEEEDTLYPVWEYLPYGMRFKGTFDGVQMSPVKIEYLIGDAFNEWDRQWNTVYKDNDLDVADEELTTLYVDCASYNVFLQSPSFTYDGEKYDGVDTLVEKIGPEFFVSSYTPETETGTDIYKTQYKSRYEGLDLVLISVSCCMKDNEQIYFKDNYSGDVANEGELQFYLVNAVYCSPWRDAFFSLRYIYLLTFLICVILVLIVRRMIRKQLIRPLNMVGEALVEERTWIHNLLEKPWKWYEGNQLERGFDSYVNRQKQLSEENQQQKDELTRIQTALDYAKEAEENRRQMSSNIAHELKTPLAVIHSYTEGLQERIAEDKRDKYLNVILSETERMDAMVLEMLDLSRLEAGRVKISRNEFSLANMAYSVFDKLALAIEAKNLQVEYQFPDNCNVKADELRIGQVIENFATNAVKYTPINGKIRVIIRSGAVNRTFAIENDCEQLDEEALNKVWDTFYRVEEARSSDGTGLGLAIAKSIVELHGGKCYVKNTENGVEFGFVL